MQAPTKMPHTDVIEVAFTVPADRVDEAKRIMREHGFEPVRDWVPWRDLLMKGDVNLLASNLAGARCKEGLTQMQLAEKTGIPRKHISEMENGKRGIGKQNARKLSAVLDIDPRLLLDV